MVRGNVRTPLSYGTRNWQQLAPSRRVIGRGGWAAHMVLARVQARNDEES